MRKGVIYLINIALLSACALGSNQKRHQIKIQAKHKDAPSQRPHTLSFARYLEKEKICLESNR